MGARRRLLTDPDPSSLRISSSTRTDSAPAKLAQRTEEPSHKDIVSNLYKLSTKELVQPTKYELAAKTRSGTKVNIATKAPRLHEFGSFEVESPKKCQQ